MKPKVLIAAGGSGGHLFPAQELAELLQKRHGCDLFFAGYKLEKSPFFDRNRFHFQEIASAPLQNPFRFLKGFAKGFWSALKLLRREKPAIVVGFGSYHTVPLLFAAALLRKKIVLYEANRVVGKVTRLIAPFASAVAIQLPLIGKSVRRTVQVPLFPWISKGNHPIGKEAARREYGLLPHRFTYLVFGGSQGASFLNQISPEVLKGRGEVQVIHLTGSEESAREVRRLYAEANISASVKAYEANMGTAYAAADFAICRSGAGTTAELIRYQIPSLLIPYPYAADDHQRHNAEFLESFGGAVWLLQKNATAKTIEERMGSLDLNAMRLALGAKREQHIGLNELDALVAKVGGFG